jgi:hypothetical protein
LEIAKWPRNLEKASMTSLGKSLKGGLAGDL